MLIVMLSGLTVCFGLLGVRLFFIQVLAHESHLETARRVVGRTDEIPAYPGDLRTRDGVIVARSRTAYDIGIDPRGRTETDLRTLIERLTAELGLAADKRRAILDRALRPKKKGVRYVSVAHAVTSEQRDAVEDDITLHLGEKVCEKSLVIDRVTRRVYPRGETLCHVIGVTSLDGRGQEGVERSQDASLSPRSGRRRVITDAREQLRFFYPENVEVAPVNGYDVVLTIDSRAQKILEEELALGIEKHRAEAGQAVLMDCRTGAIIAMTSWPRYNPNDYHRYPKSEIERRRKNRTIENVYEPGSVIKPFIAAIALERGLVTRTQQIWGGGRVHVIGRRRISDVSDHGAISFDDCVVYSSNIGMSIIGMELGRDGLIDTLDRFGFCRKTGIELPFEVSGSHTDRAEWNDVYSSVSVSFGYEVLISPIQLCTAFASLINGGYLYRPMIIDRYEIDGRVERVQPLVVGRPIREETSGAMREILHRVVQEGTGKYLRMEGFEFGGKTGTADMDPNYTEKDYLASFEAFAPYDDPEVVALVMIEKPRSGKIYGGTVAGPVVARILRRYFRVAAEPRFEKLKIRGW
jgi:cell division protein FtsI/penicillin-binding protein 2